MTLCCCWQLWPPALTVASLDQAVWKVLKNDDLVLVLDLGYPRLSDHDQRLGQTRHLGPLFAREGLDLLPDLRFN